MRLGIFNAILTLKWTLCVQSGSNRESDPVHRPDNPSIEGCRKQIPHSGRVHAPPPSHYAPAPLKTKGSRYGTGEPFRRTRTPMKNMCRHKSCTTIPLQKSPAERRGQPVIFARRGFYLQEMTNCWNYRKMRRVAVITLKKKHRVQTKIYYDGRS